MAGHITRPATLKEVETFFVLNALAPMWHPRRWIRAALPGQIIYTEFTICTFVGLCETNAGRDKRVAEPAARVDVSR